MFGIHKCNYLILDWVCGPWYGTENCSLSEQFQYSYCKGCRNYKIESSNMKITGTVPDNIEYQDIEEWLKIKFNPNKGIGYPDSKIIEKEKFERNLEKDLYDIKDLMDEVQSYITSTSEKIENYLNV